MVSEAPILGNDEMAPWVVQPYLVIRPLSPSEHATSLRLRPASSYPASQATRVPNDGVMDVKKAMTVIWNFILFLLFEKRDLLYQLRIDWSNGTRSIVCIKNHT